MDGDLTYPELFREALVVAKRMGTWVLYDIQDEPNVDYIVGYLRYRTLDFTRRRKRAESDRAQTHYKERIAYYKRAIHLAQRMGHEQHQALARRIIADLDRDPEFRMLPYVSPLEVAPGRPKTCGKLSEKPRRRPGKPRVVPLGPADFKACEGCQGVGFLRKTGSRQ